MKSEIPPDFMYRDPITGDATNGYGEIPLPWGEYPEGMDVDGEEASAYDLNRGRILMIPSQTFDQQNLGKIVAQEQGTELNDPHFITASRILHDYLNDYKTENFVRSENNTGTFANVNESNVYRVAAEEANTPEVENSEYYANWGHSFMNRFNMNLTAMGVNTAQLYDAPPGVHRAMYYLLETFDREGMTAGNIAKGFGNLAMDPFSWVGLSTLGFGVLGKAGLKKVTKETLSAFLQDSMSKNAGKLAISIAKAPKSAIGLEGGFYTAADNLMRQNVAIQANQQDGPNYAEAAAMFGLGLGGGNVLKNVMDVAPGAVSSAVNTTKNKLSDMGENAQARLDANENTTTLSSMGAGEIDKAIDTGIAKVGQRFADSQARYFETGRFEPPTAEAPVSIVKPTEAEPGIIAFHGSGADFDKFELGMINTGEGAQAFGHGLYFTDSEDIARFYRDSTSSGNQVIYKGKTITNLEDDSVLVEDNIAHMVGQQSTTKDQIRVIDDEIRRNRKNLAGIDQSIKDYNTNSKAYPLQFQGLILEPDRAKVIRLALKERLDASLNVKKNINSIEINPSGKMYKVGLAPQLDELIDYDAPLSGQTDNVRKLLEPIYEKYGVAETDDFATLQSSIPRLTSQSMLSEELSNAGLKGIKYRSSNSRTQSTGDANPEQNYVIFDDSMIKIMEKYGIVGPVAITSLAASKGREQDGN